jgi:uncharacterized protein (TIGR02271 family)
MSVLAPKPIRAAEPPPRKPDAPPHVEKPPAGSPPALEDIDVGGIGLAAAAGPFTALLPESNSAAGLAGLFKRLGFSEPAARHYYESLRRRQVLLAVESPDSLVRNTVEVMRRFGARAVEEILWVADVEDPATAETPSETFASQVTVPVVEEQLDIGKRQVSRGGVRINSQIVEQPIHESIQLREEKVSVERRQVDREATEDDLEAFKEGSIEIHETIEEPVISKRRRVVEEVVIGRETRERTQSISETVRKTQVNVEPLAPGGAPARPPTYPSGLSNAGRPLANDRVDRDGPAYRHASDLARDERYRNADWSEVEPHARRAWEDQNGGTREQFKDAVRSAWDKVSRR